MDAVPEAAAAPETPPGAGLDTPPDMEPRLSIGQVAERTGLSVHALRLYEREGLFATPVHRGAGGRRAYSEWDLEWLEVCVKLRASGMPRSAGTPAWSGREQATSKTGSACCTSTSSM